MSEQITHYDVLGVEPSADKDAIRTAYQERLGEVRADIERAQGAKKPDGSTIDGFRREEARVRSAWQVLSDPYQRGRYDATVELGAAEDVSADGEVDEEDAPAARTPAKRGRQPRARDANRPPGMFSPEHPPTPSSWPPGLTAPPPRARTLALMIDCFVLLIFFFGANFAAVEVTSSIYPQKTDRIDQLDALITKRDNAKTKADDAADSARKEAKKPFQAKSKSLQKKLDRLHKERDDLDKGIAGTRFGVLGGVFLLLSALYLIPSTMISGRTFGKRLLRVHVAMIDGSPVRLSAALKRYGMPLLVTLALFGILGQLAFAVTLFGVLTWPRNPNLQGLHDRLSRTIVVDG